MSEWIITTAITLGIGVITYFLKRTMSQVDKHGEEIRRIDNERVTKTDLKESTEELKKDIRQIREDYTPKNAVSYTHLITAMELVLKQAERNKANYQGKPNPSLLEVQRADEEPVFKKVVGGADLDVMNRNAAIRRGGK